MAIGEDTVTGAATERMIGGVSGILNGTKRNHSGVRLLDELMVDIMGGLIPGVLFNISLIICFVLPVIIFKYFQPNEYQIAKDAFDNHILVFGGSTPAIGGWFWFAAFLTFLILSYIAGHIFFRSDINLVDRNDIKTRIKKEEDDISEIIKNRVGIKEYKFWKKDFWKIINWKKKSKYGKKENVESVILSLFNSELNELNKSADTILGLNGNPNLADLKALLDSIESSINCINISNLAIKTIFEKSQKEDKDDDNIVFNLETIIAKTLFVLFPHKNKDSKRQGKEMQWGFKENKIDNIILNDLSLDEKTIYDHFVSKAKSILKGIKLDDDHNDLIIKLLACYQILLLQNDSGCSHDKEQSDFPYRNFYKYLLKRNELYLIQYVDWSQAGARTKNKVNRMKIDIQLDYTDAYAIINKNESHIRMASSSWYVSKFVKVMAKICSLVILLLLYGLYNVNIHSINNISFNNVINSLDFYTIAKICVVVSPPVILAVLISFMHKRILKFIHYQRLREIYFTLYIYHKLQTIKQKERPKIKYYRSLIRMASRETLKSLVDALCDIQNTLADNTKHINQFVSDKIEPLKAPLFYLWNHLNYGSPSDLSLQGCNSYWINTYKRSPIDFLSECIMQLNSQDLPLESYQGGITLQRDLINFYSELIKQYEY